VFHRDLLTKLNFTARGARAQFSIPLHVHQNARSHIFFDTIRKGYSGASKYFIDSKKFIAQKETELRGFKAK